MIMVLCFFTCFFNLTIDSYKILFSVYLNSLLLFITFLSGLLAFYF